MLKRRGNRKGMSFVTAALIMVAGVAMADVDDPSDRAAAAPSTPYVIQH